MSRADDPLDIEIVTCGRASGLDRLDDETRCGFPRINIVLGPVSVDNSEPAEVQWLVHSNAPDATPRADRRPELVSGSPYGCLVVPCTALHEESMTVYRAYASTSATSNMQSQTVFRLLSGC